MKALTSQLQMAAGRMNGQLQAHGEARTLEKPRRFIERRSIGLREDEQGGSREAPQGLNEREGGWGSEEAQTARAERREIR